MKKTPILIVDDQKENLLAFAALLDNPDLQLIRAKTSQEVLSKIFLHQFALILIDVHISSGMDGYEIAELVRSSMPSTSVPLLFITTDLMDRVPLFKGHDLGAVDYLVKPFDRQILQRKVGIFLELHLLRQQLQEKTQELDGKILELEVLQNELLERNQKLELFSSLDGLTGLFNRRYFDDNLLKEWKQASRDNTQLSLLIVDIDFFKSYNDYYGHQEGDDCLRKVARALYEAVMRPTDIIARYGGEEFAVILPNTGSQGAEKVARRMIDSVAFLGLVHQSSSVAEMVTVSIGGFSGFPSGKLSATSLLDGADKALLLAKKKGRNTFLMRVDDAYKNQELTDQQRR